MLSLASLLLLSAAGLTGCVPARWPSADPASLALLDESPINCLLLDEHQWTPAFLDAARARRLTLLAVAASAEQARRAVALGFDALVTESADALDAQGKPVIRMPARAGLTYAGPVVATAQGLWPGIHVEKDGAVAAAPTGAPWIDTNAGFLRYLRANAPTGAAVWIANRPPENQVLNAQRYIQAIADAAMTGARWVLALDSGFAKLLLEGEPRSVAAWQRINEVLRFYEQHRALRELPDYSTLAVLQDESSGALYSGGFLDMMGARHVPATVLPSGKLLDAPLPGVRLLLNIDPASLTPEQRDKVRAIARAGAMIVNGPPGWKLSLGDPARITFDADQIKQLDEAWKEINSLVGRRNFGVRVFGAPSMLSNLKAEPGGKRLALHLVNYSDYPVESISLHVQGKFARAKLLTPQGERAAETYAIEEGTGVDIDRIADVGIVVIE